MVAIKGSQTEAQRAIDIAVGVRIRHYRIAQGLSQTQVARAAGVSFQQLQKYENGENRVAVSRLVGIAAALQVPASRLLGEGDEPAWLDIAFAADELKLLAEYRACPAASREVLRRVASLLSAEAQTAAPTPQGD